MIAHLKLACTSVALALAVAFPAAAQNTISLTHAQGTTEAPARAEKIITFDIAALDTFDALGVDVAGVPEFGMPENLKKYESYPKMGSLFEPDYEAVAAAQPDLIIVAGRSSGAYAELSRIAPTIDVSNDWADFEGSIISNAEILGQVAGKSAEIDAMIAEFEQVKAETRAKTAGIGKGLVVMTSGGKVTAYGPGSRFGWIHETAGVEPAIADVEAATHGDAISFEFILETNPDWLFVIDRDAATGSDGAAARQVLDNELVARTTAWSKNQVVYIDPVRAYVVNGGLPALTALVRQIGDGVSQ